MKKRLLALLLLCALVVSMLAACGSGNTDGGSSVPGGNSGTPSQGSNTPSGNTPATGNQGNQGDQGNQNQAPAKRDDGIVFDESGFLVRVDGLRYDEKDYNWYIDVTVTNDTDQAVDIYCWSCTLNGYSVDVYGSIECGAKSTVTDAFTINSGSLCYLYELCGLSSVDSVGMMLHVNPADKHDVIAESTTMAVTSVAPFDIVDQKKDAMKMKSVYDDGAFKISVITVDNDFYGLSDLPFLYMMVENNSSGYVTLDFVDPPKTYEDILNDYNNPNPRNTLEINGKTVECVDLISAAGIGVTGFAPHSKSIIYIELYLEEAGIQMQDVSSIKRDFKIRSEQPGETYLDTLATFTLDYKK